jgi:predicted nucleotidyltransferase
MAILDGESAALAERSVALCRDALGTRLVGVYLHGSAVTQGLGPQSDVDLLVVAADPLDAAERGALLEGLLRLSGRYPRAPSDPRCLDVLAVTRTELAAPAYPAACQFIYGEWLRAGFEAGEPLAPFADPVVTLLLAQARGEALPLFGPPLVTLAGEVPAADVRRALADSLPELLDSLFGDERNVLLTLARMVRTAVVGDFVSKDVAAEWAAPQLEDPARSVLLEAARAYRGEMLDDWATRQQEARATADTLRDLVLQTLSEDPSAARGKGH